MKQKWPTLEGRLEHPLTSKREALEQMKKNGDMLSEQALEYIEKCLEEDENYKLFVKKFRKKLTSLQNLLILSKI